LTREWVLVETQRLGWRFVFVRVKVAFTPKGGCPLKPFEPLEFLGPQFRSSIHPQGWVPVETVAVAAAPWRDTDAG